MNAALNINDEAVRSAAYALILPEMQALDPKALLAVNLDVDLAVPKLLGALPEIRALRPEILVHLPTFRISVLDQLEEYALALSWAHSLLVTATSARNDLALLGAEAVIYRDTLYADAMSMCRHQLLNPESFKGYKGITGYRNVAADLLLVTSVLVCNWSSIEGKYPIQRDDLTRAEKIAMRMQRLIGLRAQEPSLLAGYLDNRNRAFTLLMQAYDSVRKAVTYLRWEAGDADTIAPTLYVKRNRKVGKEPQPATAEPTAQQPASPSPVQQEGSSQPSVQTARPLSVPVPGSNPFMD